MDCNNSFWKQWDSPLPLLKCWQYCRDPGDYTPVRQAAAPAPLLARTQPRLRRGDPPSSKCQAAFETAGSVGSWHGSPARLLLGSFPRLSICRGAQANARLGDFNVMECVWGINWKNMIKIKMGIIRSSCTTPMQLSSLSGVRTVTCSSKLACAFPLIAALASLLEQTWLS